MDAADDGDDDDDNGDINNDDSMTSMYGSRDFHRWFNHVIPKTRPSPDKYPDRPNQIVRERDSQLVNNQFIGGTSN